MSIPVPYPSNEPTEKAIKKIIQFIIGPTYYKSRFRISLMKDVKSLYDKRYGSVKKEIDENGRKWKTALVLMRKVNTMKMVVFPKATYRCIVIPIKTLAICFLELERSIIKFIWNLGRKRTAK